MEKRLEAGMNGNSVINFGKSSRQELVLAWARNLWARLLRWREVNTFQVDTAGRTHMTCVLGSGRFCLEQLCRSHCDSLRCGDTGCWGWCQVGELCLGVCETSPQRY